MFNIHTRKFGRILSEALRSFASHRTTLGNALGVSARRPSVPCKVGRKEMSVHKSGSSSAGTARTASAALRDGAGVTLKRLRKRTSDCSKTQRFSPRRTPEQGDTSRGEGCLPLAVGRPVQIAQWFPNSVSQQSRSRASLNISGDALTFDTLSAKAVRQTYKKFFVSLFSWVRDNAVALKRI